MAITLALMLSGLAGGLCTMGFDEWINDYTSSAKVFWCISAVLWAAAVGIGWQV